MIKADLIELSFFAIYNELVPKSGAAETVAGEILRAANRILYRWWNSGDMAGKGYGIETVNSPIHYLSSTIKDVASVNRLEILSSGVHQAKNDEYTKLVYGMLKDVTNYVIDNFDTLNVKNYQDCMYF